MESGPVGTGSARRRYRRRHGVATVLLCGGVLLTVTLDLRATPRRASGMGTVEVTRACTVLWSVPETVRTSRGSAVMVDAPEGVTWGARRTLIVGRLALETDSLGRVTPHPGAPHLYVRAGIILDARGVAELVSVPGDSVLNFPRVTALSDSLALVVWSTKDLVAPTSSDIWSAEFDGRHWSNQQLLSSGIMYQWAPTYNSEFTRESGELRFAVGMTELRSDSGIVLFRRIRGEWSTVTLRARASSYVQIADLPGDTVLLATVENAAPDGNTLFVQRFDFAGRPVGERVRVSPPGIGIVYDPQLVVGPDSVAYLVWIALPPGPLSAPGDSGTPRRLHLARSSTLGRSWAHTQGPGLALANYSWFTAMIDGRAALNVTTVVHRGGTLHPRHYTWAEPEWSATEPPRVDNGWAVNTPLLLRGSGDSLRMFWGSLRANDHVSFPGVLLSSTGVPACDETAPRRIP